MVGSIKPVVLVTHAENRWLDLNLKGYSDLYNYTQTIK